MLIIRNYFLTILFFLPSLLYAMNPANKEFHKINSVADLHRFVGCLVAYQTNIKPLLEHMSPIISTEKSTAYAYLTTHRVDENTLALLSELKEKEKKQKNFFYFMRIRSAPNYGGHECYLTEKMLKNGNLVLRKMTYDEKIFIAQEIAHYRLYIENALDSEQATEIFKKDLFYY